MKEFYYNSDGLDDEQGDVLGLSQERLKKRNAKKAQTEEAKLYGFTARGYGLQDEISEAGWLEGKPAKKH